MTATREELRDHLTAVIAAAGELPGEDRPYLADTFLDELESQFQLTPREPGTRGLDGHPGQPRVSLSRFRWGSLPFGGMVLLSVLLLPLLTISFFVLVHPPVFLLAITLLLVFRFGRPGTRRGGPRRHGPRGGNISHFYR